MMRLNMWVQQNPADLELLRAGIPLSAEHAGRY